MYHTILFDLDGTLTDSAAGITNAVAYALKKWDIEEKDIGVLRKFVGPPLTASFAKYYGFSPEKSHEAVGYYREYYGTKGIYENRVYDGIEELLLWIRETGRRAILATAKPEPAAVHVMEYFHLDPYFDVIAGASMDYSRVEKSDVIRYALERAGLSDLSGVVMVGDRENDILLRQISPEKARNSPPSLDGFLQHGSGLLLNPLDIVLRHLLIQDSGSQIPGDVHIGHREKIIFIIGLVQKLRKILPVRDPGTADNAGKRVHDLIIRIYLLVQPAAVFLCPGMQLVRGRTVRGV